ncbi:MAG: hypothetical protein DRP29_07160 [Thermodesulfobacteriota bacterium]|nr:MAG: hypothetical protein DRP29_07160 [Thermodesulfobacteriota bacterium]
MVAKDRANYYPDADSMYKDETMIFNNWNINSTWTNGTDGTCRLAASQTSKVFCVPISGLKVGDIITKFRILGQIESAGGTVTLDADLRKVTKGTSDVTDASIGAITQVSKTADYSVDVEKDITDTTVADDYAYYVKVDGTTGASTDIAITAIEVDIKRR